MNSITDRLGKAIINWLIMFFGAMIVILVQNIDPNDFIFWGTVGATGAGALFLEAVEWLYDIITEVGKESG